MFPEDGEQWKDTDGDGYGDNYLWTITYIQDEDNEQRIIELTTKEEMHFRYCLMNGVIKMATVTEITTVMISL